jgi:hypothetical protein
MKCLTLTTKESWTTDLHRGVGDVVVSVGGGKHSTEARESRPGYRLRHDKGKRWRRGKVTYSEERWRRDGVGETVEHKRYNRAIGPTCQVRQRIRDLFRRTTQLERPSFPTVSRSGSFSRAARFAKFLRFIYLYLL